MAKTYVPMAVDWAGGLHRRLTRYQTTLAAQALTPAKLAALTNLIACLAEFLSEWRKPEVQP